MPLLRRRFRRRPPAVAYLGLALVLVVGSRLAYERVFPTPGANSNAALHEGPCQIVAVLDHQTLLVRQAEGAAPATHKAKFVERRVRLIGLEFEASESAAAAERLSDATIGQPAQLKFDKRRIDREQNLLAYVYIEDALLNERLIREGVARYKEYPGDSQPMAKRLRTAQSEAKAARRGLWSADNL